MTAVKPVPVVKPIPVRQPTAAEIALKAILLAAKRQGHTASVCHAVGVWPA